jgi:uncharacterized protein (TIGR02284 family)
MAQSDITEVINELIETSKDGEKGFALAAKDAKDPTLSAFFHDGEQSCRTAAAELQSEVAKLGDNPERGGSVKGALHRGWVSVRAAATSRDDKAILEECERGEDYAKAKYSEALKLDLPPPFRDIVERQYQGVVSNHDKVRDLRNQYRAS